MSAQSSLYVYGYLNAYNDMTAEQGVTISRDLTVYGKANLEALFEGQAILQPVWNGNSTDPVTVYSDGILFLRAGATDTGSWSFLTVKEGVRNVFA
ncbi:hypothetical protein ACFQYP_25310 [Nonomuraea antimicrobica]